ncbi:hypothetical protein Tco_0083913 [Tanacetum coccineum]
MESMGSSPFWNTGTIRPESGWENSEVLMIDELSIVRTDKVIHTVETDMVKLVVEIECFGMSFDEFDKEIGSSDGLQPKQADLSCVHALNKPHLHEIHVVPSKHEADQYVHVIEQQRESQKKCLSDEILAIPLDEIQIDEKLHLIEEPVEIMDREVKRLKQSRIPIDKVRWNSKRGPEFTWEHEDQMQKKYPHLFSNSASGTDATS